MTQDITTSRLTVGALWQIVLGVGAIFGVAYAADARMENKIKNYTVDYVKQTDLIEIKVSLERLHAELRGMRKDVRRLK